MHVVTFTAKTAHGYEMGHVQRVFRDGETLMSGDAIPTYAQRLLDRPLTGWEDTTLVLVTSDDGDRRVFEKGTLTR